MKRNLLASSLLAGVAAFGVPAGVALVTSLAPSVVLAQDFTAGILTGEVTDSEGNPIPGAQVTVRSNEQGLTRNVTTSEQGDFRVPTIPLGNYTVTVEAAGFQSLTNSEVRVRLGGSSAYNFTVLREGEVEGAVVVAGRRPELDFTQTTTGITIDLEELTKQLPIGRDITSVTLLAPQTIEGDTGIGVVGGAGTSLPSIAGSSLAENAFYINGLNITNFDTYVGASAVPFDFYRTVEVKTGGYHAEFGRATGGVINAVSKSGSNDFEFAVHGNYNLADLRERQPNTFAANNARDWDQTLSTSVEAGGPIIRDRLFFYGLAEFRQQENRFASITGGSYNIDTSDDPFYGFKLDGYITDDHRLEFTWFDTTREVDRETYSYNGTTDVIGATVASRTKFAVGGENWVARYTGSFTDWLTISAAYGQANDQNSTLPANTTNPQVRDARSGTTIVIANPGAVTFDANTTYREFYRVDADMFFRFMGDHHIRVGYDRENTELTHGNQIVGDRLYTYRRGGPGDLRGVPAGVDYVQVQYQQLGGPAINGENESFYFQDAWDVTDRLTLSLGLRNDIFRQADLAGQDFLDLNNNWGPRLGFTYDLIGDGRTKVFGNYGRYFIPPASNLSFRGADFGYSEFFRQPAGGFVINPTTGLPGALGPQISGFPGAEPCPNPSAGYPRPLGTPGTVGCSIPLGEGIPFAAEEKQSTELTATSEDEFIVGIEHRLTDLWSFGAAFNYRRLNDVSEDISVDRFTEAYCTRIGVPLASCPQPGQYVVANPGRDFTYRIGGTLPGESTRRYITVTAAESRFELPEREYLGLEMTFERGFDGLWGLQGSYTLSRSQGNYEGTVLSDVDQDDAGSTQLFDYYGLSENQYGFLPNHRAHQIKVFGSYQMLENLLVGGNLRINSGRPYGCLGVHPTDLRAQQYGASSRYCRSAADPTNSVPVRRGTRTSSDWEAQIDLSARYTLDFLPGNLVLRADVFNVLNAQTAVELDETGETSGGVVNPTYLRPTRFQSPRQVRLGFDWAF